MNDPLFFFQEKTPSGATMYCQERMDLPWVEIRVIVHAGERHDPPDRPGTAHLLEHLVPMGNEGYPRKEPTELYEWAVEQGFQMDWGVTGTEGTWYTGRAAVRNSWKLAEYMHALVLRPELRSDLEHERDIIREERTEAASRRVRDARRVCAKALFHGAGSLVSDHPLSRIWAWPEDDILNAMTYDDVRWFHDTYYACPNMSIIAVGGMEVENLMSMLDVVFKERPGRLWTPPRPQPVPDLGIMPAPRSHYCIAPGNSQAESVDLFMSWVKPRSDNRADERLLTNALETLLYDRVRERERAAYSVDVDLARLRDCTIVTMSTVLQRSNLSRVQDVITKTLEDDDALAAEVPKVQREILLDTELADDTVEDILEIATDRVLDGDPVEPMSDILARYAELTPDDIVSMRREHLPMDRAFTLTIEK